MTLDTKELLRVRNPEASKIKFRDTSVASDSVVSVSNETSSDSRWPTAVDAKSVDSFEKRRSNSPGSVSMGSSIRFTPTSQYYAANRGMNRLKTKQGDKPSSSLHEKVQKSESPITGRDIDEKTRAFHQLCKDFDATELEIP
jgi:hypothetical protein